MDIDKLEPLFHSVRRGYDRAWCKRGVELKKNQESYDYFAEMQSKAWKDNDDLYETLRALDNDTDDPDSAVFYSGKFFGIFEFIRV